MPDAFPYDASQWNDSDGDGHGDNPFGSQGDWFPTDPNRWHSDQDGYADEDDAFINDATQWNDSDGDGYGDEESGNRPDIFPMDPNEWEDTDGDGMATTVMLPSEAHNGTIPIMMVTEITLMEPR